ncbi:MAG: hypothetical protein ACJ73S_31300 [Mycobacteriales bacterium]
MSTRTVHTRPPLRVEAGAAAGGRRLPPRYAAGTAAVVFTGIAIRCRQWWHARSLWLDELFVADNLRRRSPAGLARPLEHHQSPPLGWLWMEKAAMAAAGSGERALRLPALVSGCGLLVLLAVVAYRLLPGFAAPVTVGLAAVNPSLVYYSNEVKPYSFEALAALALLAAVPATAGPGSSRRWLRWWALAAVAAWFATSSAVVTAALAGVSAVPPLLARRGPELARLLAGAPAWLASLAVLYPLQLAPARHDRVLVRYWAYAFPPPTPHAWIGPHWWASRADWVGVTAQSLARDPVGSWVAWPAIALAATGLVRVAHRYGTPLAWLLAATPAVAMLADLAGAYPLTGRLAVYLLPAVMLLFGAAVHRPRGRTAVTTWLLLAAVGAPQLRSAVQQAARPPSPHAYRQAVAYVAAHRDPRDAVTYTAAAAMTAAWYGRELRVPTLPCHPHLWLIDTGPPYDPAALTATRARLRRLGPETRPFTAASATVYRYTLRPACPP